MGSKAVYLTLIILFGFLCGVDSVQGEECPLDQHFLLYNGATCSIASNQTCVCMYAGDQDCFLSSANFIECLTDLYDGDCLPIPHICDGITDCNNGTDEDNCPCVQDEFSCGSEHKCLSYHKVCDGTADCTDGTDELQSRCENLTCPDGWTLCNDSSRCLRYLDFCNGITNCVDNSDELPNDCKLPEEICPQDDIECIDKGHCYHIAERCDGLDHCPSGDDELGCYNYDTAETDNTIACTESELRCVDNSKCIPLAAACDYVADCNDESDESSHLCIHYCPDDNTTFNPNNYCDGVQTCNDWSDETLESDWCDEMNTYCPEENFRCRNPANLARIYMCIRSEYICDNYTHCPYAFDINDNCDALSCPQTSIHFRCPDGSCIARSAVCDGYKIDCPGASDEFSCQPRYCADTEWSCAYGAFCISKASYCDGYRDCPDGSDETHSGCPSSTSPPPTTTTTTETSSQTATDAQSNTESKPAQLITTTENMAKAKNPNAVAPILAAFALFQYKPIAYASSSSRVETQKKGSVASGSAQAEASSRRERKGRKQKPLKPTKKQYLKDTILFSVFDKLIGK